MIKTFCKTIFLLALVVGTIYIIRRNYEQPTGFQSSEGRIFGTYYHIKYDAPQPLDSALLAELQKVDASLSLFNRESTLSRINDGRTAQADTMTAEVFRLARRVAEATGGAFDPTVAPLVNAWGFGFKNADQITRKTVDSLLGFVGYEKIALRDGIFAKQDSRVQMDFGAIAKGYGVDRAARVLRAKGVKNFMVEIGGEVVTSGRNPLGKPWSIGVSRPTEADEGETDEVQTILSLTDCALATSGNYRNFYYRDGKRYAHTISPHTGRPVAHSLLSASVIAPTCAEADAFATAFMVMGLDKARETLAQQPQLEAYFIYSDANGALRVWQSKGFPRSAAD